MERTPEQLDLIKRVRDKIFNEPEAHRQDKYLTKSECGTTGCVAGWAALLSFPNATPNWIQFPWAPDGLLIADYLYLDDTTFDIDSEAGELLGIGYEEACYLFSGSRTRGEVLEFLDWLLEDDEASIQKAIDDRY